MNNTILGRLEALRSRMKAEGIDAVIIPHVDPHQSEYMSDHWHVRQFFSNFSGSAGTLVVTLSDAALWTDSRYFLQAAEQLDGTSIRLMKDGVAGTPSVSEYLVSALRPGMKVGIDGMLFSIESGRQLRSELEAHGLTLDVDFHPADGIWTDRPPMPADKVFIHDIKYAGRPSADKISEVLAEVRKIGAGATLVCALDAIAWTLNLRGNDVAYNPVFTSFLYLSADGGNTLFVDEGKVDADVREYLSANGVTTAPYSSVGGFLSELPAKTRVLVDPSQASSALVEPLGKRLVEGISPINMLKGIKNEVEIAGIRRAHIRDGVALVKAFMELERRLDAGEMVTEIDVADILVRHRSEQANYLGESFGTICGYRAHGAIVHYEAEPATNSTLKPEGLLLIDSGAQYLDGTTDITRTISLGCPSADERHDFTLVMKGHIALSAAVFPVGTNGVMLDVLAHEPLWKECKTYTHGTGHGVGVCLNVHEGPQSFRNRVDSRTIVPFVPGMITSDEPGLYIAGSYGIRCENLILTVDHSENEYGRFLAFAPVTLFPFDLSLFDTSMMTSDEILWVNDYHRQVRDALTPYLASDERVWLENATKVLG